MRIAVEKFMIVLVGSALLFSIISESFWPVVN